MGAKALQDLGYAAVESMRGGMNAWYAARHPVEIPVQLTKEQKERYSRHILVPEVGEKGQAKLLESRVLLIGAGGLGSPAALYLAAAGVGTLGIVDADVVDVTNLQRQVIHTTRNIGKPKTESAAEAIRNLNPDVKLKLYGERISPENAFDIIEDYDVVVDGCDNFDTRYLVSDVCVRLMKPNLYGSIFRFEGQVSAFLPGGPCYRCLFPERPPEELAPG